MEVNVHHLRTVLQCLVSYGSIYMRKILNMYKVPHVKQREKYIFKQRDELAYF